VFLYGSAVEYSANAWVLCAGDGTSAIYDTIYDWKLWWHSLPLTYIPTIPILLFIVVTVCICYSITFYGGIWPYISDRKPIPVLQKIQYSEEEIDLHTYLIYSIHYYVTLLMMTDWWPDYDAILEADLLLRWSTHFQALHCYLCWWLFHLHFIHSLTVLLEYYRLHSDLLTFWPLTVPGGCQYCDAGTFSLYMIQVGMVVWEVLGILLLTRLGGTSGVTSDTFCSTILLHLLLLTVQLHILLHWCNFCLRWWCIVKLEVLFSTPVLYYLIHWFTWPLFCSDDHSVPFRGCVAHSRSRSVAGSATTPFCSVTPHYAGLRCSLIWFILYACADKLVWFVDWFVVRCCSCLYGCQTCSCCLFVY